MIKDGPLLEISRPRKEEQWRSVVVSLRSRKAGYMGEGLPLMGGS